MKKTVFITGASSGFGTNLARAFARAGYVVIIHGRDEKRLWAVKNDIFKTEKVECQTVVADLRQADGLEAVKTAIHAFKINILVNNAAINPELDREAMGDDIDSIISTNMSSAIALCRKAFSHFKATGGGMIMNINSVAALRGSAHEAMYAASKFGLRGFSESVKEEWLKQGVYVIDVYPGAIAVGMSSKRLDVHNLINPGELAEFLVGLCATKSFFVKELNVRRTAVGEKA